MANDDDDSPLIASAPRSSTSHLRRLPENAITVDAPGSSSAAIDTVLADLNRNKDFKFIAAVAKLVLLFMRKFWTACTTCFLVLVALYWLYGGLVTFVLCSLGLLGEKFNQVLS
jgi:hypothetical protein